MDLKETVIMSQNQCCVKGCSSKASEGIPMHHFPNPLTDVDRFKKWKTKVGPNFGKYDDIYISKNRKICHRHFEKVYHGSKNRLVKSAIPSLHLPVDGKRLPAASSPPVPMEVVSEANEAPASICVEQPFDNDSDSNSEDDVLANHRVKINPPKPRIPTSKLKHRQAKFIAKEERLLLKAISRLNAMLKKKRSDTMAYKRRPAVAEKMSLSKAFDVISKKMTKAAKLLFEIQSSQSTKKGSGIKFSLEQKIMALSTYRPSPKAYRLLSQLCILPKLKTLEILLAQDPLRQGIDKSSFTQLEQKIKSFSQTLYSNFL